MGRPCLLISGPMLRTLVAHKWPMGLIGNRPLWVAGDKYSEKQQKLYFIRRG